MLVLHLGGQDKRLGTHEKLIVLRGYKLTNLSRINNVFPQFGCYYVRNVIWNSTATQHKSVWVFVNLLQSSAEIFNDSRSQSLLLVACDRCSKINQLGVLIRVFLTNNIEHHNICISKHFCIFTVAIRTDTCKYITCCANFVSTLCVSFEALHFR